MAADDFTPEGITRLITANNDMLDEWYADRGVTTERMDMKAEIARLTAENEALRAEATRLRGELARVEECLLDATAHLVGAASAYRKHASRHISQGRALPDPMFGTRALDFDKAADRATAAIRALEPRHD